MLQDVEAGRNAKPSLASPAGEKAAEIVGNLARSPAAPADLSNAAEEQARANFQSDQGMFMVNWPYVLAAARTAAEEGTLDQAVVDDIGWARYPRVFADRPSAPPLGGANLGIGAYSKHPDQAVAAGRVHQRRTEGHPVHARRERAVAVRGVLRRPRGPGEVRRTPT